MTADPIKLSIRAADATLGEIVAARPWAASLFEQLGLDYCCGGGREFAVACRERDLDPAAIEVQLAALEAEAHGEHDHDVRALTVTELSRHIVDRHHEPARPKMARISELLDKVVRAHGEQDPSVEELRDKFTELRRELGEHMSLEEAELFPACCALEQGVDRPDERLLDQLRDTHSETGAGLAELRRLGNDYEPDSAHCATHRVLLSELVDFELDLHQHIHEENNVLFPAVGRLAAGRQRATG